VFGSVVAQEANEVRARYEVQVALALVAHMHDGKGARVSRRPLRQPLQALGYYL
jgi:hypothetical protein